MSHDTTLHRLIRPSVRLAAPSGVSPNQITTLRLLTALGAAGAVATGQPVATAIGGGVFLLSMLLDRADGELARQTGRSSAAGHVYDLAADCTANAAVLVGLGFGRAAELGWVGPAMGLLAGGGVGMLFWLLNVVRNAPVSGFSFLRDRLVFDPDDAMVFLPVLLWLGLSTPTLVVAGLVTPAAAVWLACGTLRCRLLANRLQAGGDTASAGAPGGVADPAASSRRQA